MASTDSCLLFFQQFSGRQIFLLERGFFAVIVFPQKGEDFFKKFDDSIEIEGNFHFVENGGVFVNA